MQLTGYLVTNDFIIQAGWQQAYRVLGIIAAAISIPVTLFIVRGTPKEKGLLPYGTTEEQGANK